MVTDSRRLAVLSLWLATGPTLAWAQLPAGGEFRVDDSTTFNQFHPKVAMDANGDFVAVWRDELDGSLFGTRHRRFAARGVPKGPGFLVNSYTTGFQAFPAIASDAVGNFVVTWGSNPQDGQGYGIFGQRYDTSGARRDGEFQVNEYTGYDQRFADVAADASGNFVAVWTAGHQDGSGYGIWGRRYDAQGAALGPEFRVNTYTTGGQVYPSVASNRSGNFVVAWTGPGHDGSNYSILAQRFDAAGSPQGNEFQVTESGALIGQIHPDVALADDGQFAVVWHAVLDGSGEGIRARAYDAAGVPRGSEFAVNTYTTGSHRLPGVAWTESGHFTVVWRHWDQSTGGYGTFSILGQRFDESGTAQGLEFRVDSNTTARVMYPAIASKGNGDFVVVWSGLVPPENIVGIYGQRYGDMIFREDFESGSLARWSATATDGLDLSVADAGALAQTGLGMQAIVDDTASLWVQDDSPGAENRYRARFYFDPNGFDPGEAAGNLRVRLFIAFNGANERLATIVLRRLGGAYSVRGRVRRDDGTRADTDFFPLTDAPHRLDLEWLRSSGPGANSGEFRLWIDDVLASTISSVDNDGSAVEFARLGVMTVKTPLAGGTLYFDQFESRRLNPIGP